MRLDQPNANCVNSVLQRKRSGCDMGNPRDFVLCGHAMMTGHTPGTDRFMQAHLRRGRVCIACWERRMIGSGIPIPSTYTWCPTPAGG